MGRETRGTGRYYYRKQRAGADVRSVYVPGFAAPLAAREAAERQRLNEQARGLVAADRAEGERVLAACRGLRAEVRRLLTAAGFHEHKREWRRKRMAKNAHAAGRERPRSREEADEVELFTQAIMSHEPSEAAKALVARELSYPDACRLSGDLLGTALSDSVRRLSDSYLTGESIRRGLEEMRAELGFDGSTLPERLLVEQVLLCWLRLGVLKREQTRVLAESRLPSAYTRHLEAATTQAQRRYTNAITALAKVRRLLRPRGPLFQVNVLAVAGEGPGREPEAITVGAGEIRRLGGGEG